MDKKAVHALCRRRILAGWAAAACGIVTLGTSPTVAGGAEPDRLWDGDHRSGRLQRVSSEHRWAADEAPRRSSFQEADTAGLWDGYQRGGCQNCEPAQSAQPSVCGCDHARGKSKNPIFRVLDGFAGGIEHMVGLDGQTRTRREATCDDGCDAVTLRELRQLDVHAVPMVKPTLPAPPADKPANAGAKGRSVPAGPQPTSKPDERQRRPVPAPVLPDAKIDPFADEAAWTPGRNPAIERSAYFE